MKHSPLGSVGSTFPPHLECGENRDALVIGRSQAWEQSKLAFFWLMPYSICRQFILRGIHLIMFLLLFFSFREPVTMSSDSKLFYHSHLIPNASRLHQLMCWDYRTWTHWCSGICSKPASMYEKALDIRAVELPFAQQSPMLSLRFWKTKRNGLPTLPIF